MQRGPMRPLMTGCILYLLLMAVLFLLSDFLYVQIALVLFLILGLSVCAYLAGIERIVLPRILSSRNFCIGLVVAAVIAAVGVWEFYNLAVAKGTEPQRWLGIVASAMLVMAAAAFAGTGGP